MHVYQFGRTLERYDAGPLDLQKVAYLALGALIFQMVHFVEHIAQLAHWFMSPAAPPWLTPWAETGRDLLVVDGTQGSGNELLHLVGNLIFLAGLVALAWISRAEGLSLAETPNLKRALMVQGFHVFEHLSLTATYLGFGSAVGLSTLFGTAQGTFGIGLRVWGHFVLNLVATYYAARAGKELLATRRRRAVLNDPEKALT